MTPSPIALPPFRLLQLHFVFILMNVWWRQASSLVIRQNPFPFSSWFFSPELSPFSKSTCSVRCTKRIFHAGNLLRMSASDKPSIVAAKRKELLHKSLKSLDIDAEELYDAALQSIQDPTAGYDGRYGKSAIKTYRAFLYPKQTVQEDPVKLPAAALRSARQIEFLLKRHKSHQAEWVRHTDEKDAQRKSFPLILLLDNVRSAFNVGSIFRTADAAGCEQVITTGITPHPGGSGADKLRKSALGAELIVPSRHFATTKEAVGFLRKELPQYQLVGMETTEQSIVYTEMRYPKDGIALVLGNEVTGVDTDIIPQLDAMIEIPMFGAKNSLNVAACAPIVLYEVLRQWKKS